MARNESGVDHVHPRGDTGRAARERAAALQARVRALVAASDALCARTEQRFVDIEMRLSVALVLVTRPRPGGPGHRAHRPATRLGPPATPLGRIPRPSDGDARPAEKG